jgi:dihydrofolate synthase/folylpolyglutamate synthase
MISEQTVVEWVEAHRAFLDNVRPSFFETTMAMAFWYFAEQKVDIAVVEVGLGGRLDSTNVLTPLLSVITNIGIDHTEFLGDTLPQIAAEKAGIIKLNVPCVVGEMQEETFPIFEERARACEIWGEGPETTDCRIWFANQCGFMRKRRKKEAPECQLKGVYQEHNLQTAFVALQVLRNICGVELDSQSIADGFAHVCDLTELRGRWEILSTQPLTICDTGHNSHGIRYVAEQLNALLVEHRLTNPDAQLRIVLGMVNDKDIDDVLALLPIDAVYYFTQPHTSRALSAEAMYSKWMALHPEHWASRCYEQAQEALRLAQSEASSADIIFVGGSNYLVGELLTLLLFL